MNGMNEHFVFILLLLISCQLFVIQANQHEQKLTSETKLKRFGFYGNNNYGSTTPTSAPTPSPTSAPTSSSNTYGWMGSNRGYVTLNLTIANTLLSLTSITPSSASDWIQNSFIPSFASVILRSPRWQVAYNYSVVALNITSRISSLPTGVKSALQKYLEAIKNCQYCFGNVSSLQPMSALDSIPGAVSVYRSVLLTIGLQPMTCNRSVDFCTNLQLSDTNSYFYYSGLPVCTKSYCWFNPGKNCTPSSPWERGYYSNSYVATCQSVDWLKSKNIQCPITNCEHVSRRSTVFRSGTRLTSTEKLVNLITSILKRKSNRKRATCTTTTNCGDCQSDEVTEMDECAGVDLNNSNVCCVCTVSTSAVSFF